MRKQHSKSLLANPPRPRRNSGAGEKPTKCRRFARDAAPAGTGAQGRGLAEVSQSVIGRHPAETGKTSAVAAALDGRLEAWSTRVEEGEQRQQQDSALAIVD